MKIELNGYNIDNLLKIVYTKKVALYNVVRNEHNKVHFEILDKDYKKVKRYTANYKVKTALSKHKQIPKFIIANLGVLLGCFLGAILGIFLSNYTWQIQIYGTKDLTQQNILKVLEDNGIKKGKVNSQSSEEIENILLNNYDKIAQVSVIKRGTAIIINLSEKLVYQEQSFEPICAQYNGIIKEINIITGTTNIKVGDYVQTGDLLVLPFNVNADGSKVSVVPMAEIKAEIYVVNKAELKKQEEVLVKTGKFVTDYYYKYKTKNLFSKRAKNPFAFFMSVVYNENISDLIPFNRDVVIHYELTKTIITHDFEKEKEYLISQCENTAHNLKPSGEILSENTTTQIVGDSMFCVTTLIIYGIIN